jgi:hypothetical protein
MIDIEVTICCPSAEVVTCGVESFTENPTAPPLPVVLNTPCGVIAKPEPTVTIPGPVVVARGSLYDIMFS